MHWSGLSVSGEERRDERATWGNTNTALNSTSHTHRLLPPTKVRDARMDHGTGKHSPPLSFPAIFMLMYTSLRIISDLIAGWSVTVPLRSFSHGSYCVPLLLWIFYTSVPSYRPISVAFAFNIYSQVLHLGQATRYRTWWLLPTACFCGVIEILGWSGRLWSSFSPLLTTPYQIQWVELVSAFLHVIDQVYGRTICTIVAPTPLLAVNFALLEDMIKRLGPDYSRLSPKWRMSLLLVLFHLENSFVFHRYQNFHHLCKFYACETFLCIEPNCFVL